MDFLSLISQYARLKKVAGTNGGEWAGPCPMCGGRDRFRVQPQRERWLCRQCNPHWQDDIAFMMEYHECGFREALALVGRGDQRKQRPVEKKPPTPDLILPNLRDDYACFHPHWQQRADDLVNYAYRQLRDTEEGQRLYWDYLIDQRQLTPAVIDAHDLGYLPAAFHDHWGEVEVYLPAGIVIPWRYGGRYWTIRVRRLDDHQPKYAQPKGAANALYYGSGYVDSPITPRHIVVLVEGEFDKMAVRIGASDLGAQVFPVALGSASAARTMEWVSDLCVAKAVLLAQDNDSAGEESARWWQHALGDKAYRLLPTVHDPNEMLILGDDIKTWIQSPAKFLLSEVLDAKRD